MNTVHTWQLMEQKESVICQVQVILTSYVFVLVKCLFCNFEKEKMKKLRSIHVSLDELLLFQCISLAWVVILDLLFKQIRGTLRTLSNIYDGAFFCETSEQPKAVTFAKELHHRCLTGSKITQISLKQTIMQASDYCRITFSYWEYIKTSAKVLTTGKVFLIESSCSELTIKC